MLEDTARICGIVSHSEGWVSRMITLSSGIAPFSQ